MKIRLMIAAAAAAVMFTVISCKGSEIPLTVSKIPVTVSNQSKTNFITYVVFEGVSGGYKQEKSQAIGLAKSSEAEIYLKTGEDYDIVFIDTKGYQYVLSNVGFSKNDKAGHLVISESNFEPRNPIETVTKRIGLQAAKKDVTHVKN